MTKSDMVRSYVAQGKYKEALRIAKDFRLNISPEDHECMSLGYECMLYPDFYFQIGYNPSKIAQNAKAVVQRLYGIQNTLTE